MGAKKGFGAHPRAAPTDNDQPGKAVAGGNESLHPPLRKRKGRGHGLKTVSTQHMLMEAAKAGADPAVMREFMWLIREEKEELAKEALNQALTAFGGDCPIIKKLKPAGKPGKLTWKFADLGTIKDQIPPLDKYGLSYSFDNLRVDEGVKIRCTIRHVMGAETHADSPVFQIDEALFTNPSQKTGSAQTYAQRSAFANALGLIFEAEDDDAAGTGQGLQVEEVYGYFRAFTRAFAEHYPSVMAIKDLLAQQQIEQAREAWAEIPQQDQINLWLAPTKGGVLTTEERAMLKFGEKWREQLQRK